MNGDAIEGVLALVAELRRETLVEPGCQGYDVFRNTDNPCEILLLERYRDDSAIEAHRGSAHYKDLVVQRILPLLSDRKVELLRARDAG
jgi:quinol monooxygenase YgiN